MALRDVIKYEGTKDVLVFKHPIEDFNRHAQLIVHEKQEAIVFMDGEAKTLYSPGKYELTSKNIPGLKHVVALFSGGELANHCEVYFINKLLFANIPWITTPMDIQDPTLKVFYAFQAQGFFSVHIENSYALFEIVGNERTFTIGDLKDYFQDLITSTAKVVLSNAMVQDGLSYGEINSHLDRLSGETADKLKTHFERIGLVLEKFSFDSVIIEKTENYQKQLDHLTERFGQQVEGYSYGPKRAFDVLEAQAKNQGSAGAAANYVTGTMFGANVGQAYSGMMGGAFDQAFSNPQGNMGNGDAEAGIVKPHPVQTHENHVCRKCHKELDPSWKYCPFCNEPTSADNICSVCGKGAHFGNNVSHSHRRSNRMWKSNIKRVKILVKGAPRHAYVCTHCLRSGKVERA